MSALRGYSLRGLGRRAHVSPSMLSRIINGQRQASPAFVSAAARALSVSISVLHGQPYIHQLQADQLDRLTTPISTALDDWDIPLGEGDPPPRTLTHLQATVAGLEQQRARAEYIELAHELPALLAEVNTHVLTQRSGHALEQAAWLQAELCRTVYVVGRQIGFLDLARLALSRMAVAAPLSGDPRQVAIERWDRAQLMADAARHDRGVLLVKQALKDLDGDGRQATKAVRGDLHLKGAILSYTVTAVNSTGRGWTSHAIETKADPPASSALRGTGWRDDALHRARTGSAIVRGSTVRVPGAHGDGLGEGDDYRALSRDIEDELHFVSRPATGSFTLTARVDSARGPLTGLMLRDRLTADTRHLCFGVDAEGRLVFHNRTRDGRHDWQDDLRSPLTRTLQGHTLPSPPP